MSVQPTCATCRHWTPPSERTDYMSAVNIEPAGEYDDPDRQAKWEQASAAKHEADKLYGPCRAINLEAAHVEHGDPLPLAVARDGSDYMAVVLTQAEFGCVLHEPRESTS